MAGRRYVILGDGAAGMSAVETLRRLDPAGAITVVSDDPHPTYFRAALTNYLLGELRDEQVWAVPPSFYGDQRASRLLSRAVGVDPKDGRVHLANGAPLPYEALLVATGARPRPAPFEGADLPGVLALRTLQDARRVMELVAHVERAVVVGGGPLALEWAHALRERGLAVTLVARGDRVMPEVLDRTASDLVLARLRRGGIEVRMGDEIASASAGEDGRVAAVTTRGGVEIQAELVAVAIGVVCNTEGLGASGVALGPRGGVAVTDRLRASVPGIFAAGDVAELGGRLLQLWEPARAMAAVAAANMTGADEAYAPGAHYMATRLYDLDFAAVGALDAEDGDEERVDFPKSTGTIAYRRLVLRGGRLRGALMIGERSEGVRARGRLYKRLVDLGADATAVADKLLDPGFDLRAWIDTRAVVARPARSPAGPPLAEVRGTQRVTLPTRLGLPVVVAKAIPAPTVAQAPMLSIGLRSPAAASPLAADDLPVAKVERGDDVWELDHAVASIGREGTIAIDDPAMSLHHAEIVAYDGTRYVRDVGSTNGTRVNGEIVTVPRALRDGDVIRVGATDLVFCTPTQEKASATRRAPEPAPRHDGHEIEVMLGPAVGLRFALRGAEVSVGRDASSAVRLDDITVSRRHATLAARDGRWLLTDLRSSRGTALNGVPVAPGAPQPLDDGDTITVGEVVLAFHAPRAPERAGRGR